jgi:N-acetylglucosamine malate deacetylase 1
MILDVLAIAAHPDDIEIICGGTMIKLADHGKKTGILDLTAGEMGTLGSVEARLAESQAAAEIMGVTTRENLGLPDSGLEISQDNKLRIAAIIRKYKPQLVILPVAENQRHPDHHAASVLGHDACFLAGLRKLNLDGEPHRPRKIIYVASFEDAPASFAVDISEQFERKLKAVAAYKSQFDGSEQSRQSFRPGNDIFELMQVYGRRHGMSAGCRFAETFRTGGSILLNDPLDLLPPVK